MTDNLRDRIAAALKAAAERRGIYRIADFDFPHLADKVIAALGLSDNTTITDIGGGEMSVNGSSLRDRIAALLKQADGTWDEESDCWLHQASILIRELGLREQYDQGGVIYNKRPEDGLSGLPVSLLTGRILMTKDDLAERVTTILCTALYTEDEVIDNEERDWVKTDVAVLLIEELGLRRDEEQSWVTLSDDQGDTIPHPCRRYRWVTEWEDGE